MQRAHLARCRLRAGLVLLGPPACRGASGSRRECPGKRRRHELVHLRGGSRMKGVACSGVLVMLANELKVKGFFNFTL